MLRNSNEINLSKTEAHIPFEQIMTKNSQNHSLNSVLFYRDKMLYNKNQIHGDHT